ncbi:MAG TPA: hypothetical protein VHB77_02320 [Planctomycetaceae bacterium]|nr:hypothetical protein [Planctomycetaceae bacterium]
MAVVCVPLGYSIWYGQQMLHMARYGHRSQRINDKIAALEDRKPHDVSEKMWEECVAWASIAHCNICFSEGHASYEAMCRFEQQLDAKLEEDVNLATIEWIGDRLAETGPHGRTYMTKLPIQWKQTLQELLKKTSEPDAVEAPVPARQEPATISQ